MPQLEIEAIGKRVHVGPISFRLNRTLRFLMPDAHIRVIAGKPQKGVATIVDLSDVHPTHIPARLLELNGKLIDWLSIAMTPEELEAYNNGAAPTLRSGLTYSPLEKLVQRVKANEPSLQLRIYRALD